MNKVIAVVVTYNRINLLRQCIEHLQKQSMSCDILIVDNASTDGTDSFMQQLENEHIFYYNPGRNLGGAGGFHLGMRLAVESGQYEYIWMMDDDCLPEQTALEKLMEADAALQGTYGWLSSQCLWTDGRICQMNVQRKTPFTDIKDFSQNLIPAQMASFVSLFLKSKTIEQFGLPIKEFFIWTDDWEYTRRISRTLPCYVVRDSHVVHAMKSPIVVNIATDTAERLSRYQYFYRNDIYLYRCEGLKGCLWILAKDVWHSIQIIANRKAMLKKLCIVWKNAWKGVWFHPIIDYCEKDSSNIITWSVEKLK